MMQHAKPAVEARSRIMDVAARLFRERGYAAVSLRAIAEAANMKAGSLYYHFASKEELVVEILNQGIRTVHDDVVRAIEGAAQDDPKGVLRAAIVAHLESLLRQSDYTSANIRIFGQVPDNVRAQNLAVRRAYEGLWDRLIRDLGKSAEVSPTAEEIRLARMMVLGALNASLEWFKPSRGSIKSLADRYTDLLWHGFAAKFANERRD